MRGFFLSSACVALAACAQQPTNVADLPEFQPQHVLALAQANRIAPPAPPQPIVTPISTRDKAIAPYVSDLIASRDDMDGTTVYHTPTMHVPYSFAIVSHDNGDLAGFLTIEYAGDNWLFIKRIAISVAGQKIYDHIVTQSDDVKRHVNAYAVTEERVSIPIRRGDIDRLGKIGQGDSPTIIRLYGEEGYKDYTPSHSEAAAIGSAVHAFAAIAKTGKPTFSPG